MILPFFLLYSGFLFWYGGTFLHIGTIEVITLETNPFISSLVNLSFFLFGKSDFTFRLPSLITALMSLLLYYRISQYFLKRERDIFFSLLLFSLMPGFMISALLINKAIFLIFLILLFIYAFIYFRFFSYLLLVVFTFLDYSFIALYFSLVFYSVYRKDTKLLFFTLLLLTANANYFDYTIGGHPRGHFMEWLVVYAAIFSPFVFIYFIMALMKSEKNIVWFISFFSFFISMILSFRQRIHIDDFAPYVIVSVLFMVKSFLSSYRVRLKVFRQKYRVIYGSLLVSLLLFDLIMFFNTPLYTTVSQPKKHLAYDFSFSKETAEMLREKGIDNITCEDKILCKKLHFYGIGYGNTHYVSSKMSKKAEKIFFSYRGREVFVVYVTKLNN